MQRLPKRVRLALAVLAGAALFGVGIALADSTATVSLTSTGPQPATVTINWGDTVAFVNVDAVAHSLASTATEIGTTTVAPGQTLPVAFAGKVGLKRYTMSGKPRNFIFSAVDVTLNGTLDLTAKTNVVTYGKSTQLTGTLSLSPGAAVSIQSRPLNQFLNGAGEWKPIAGPFPTSGSGTFSYGATPAAGAEYQAVAAAGQLLSKTVKIVVVPLIVVAPPKKVTADRAFTFPITVRPAKAAQAVDLESYIPRLKQWHSIGRLRLTRAGRATAKLNLGAGRALYRVSIGSHELAAAGFGSVSSKPFAISAR